MNPTTFTEPNTAFKAPADLDEKQCMAIPAFAGRVDGGSCDGAQQIIVAWHPTPERARGIERRLANLPDGIGWIAAALSHHQF